MVPLPNFIYYMDRFNTRKFLMIFYSVAIVCKLVILIYNLFFNSPLTVITTIRCIVCIFSIVAEILILYMSQDKVYKEFRDTWFLSCLTLHVIYFISACVFAFLSNEGFVIFFFVSKKYLAVYLVVNVVLAIMAWTATQAERNRAQRLMKAHWH